MAIISVEMEAKGSGDDNLIIPGIARGLIRPNNSLDNKGV